MAEFGRFVRVPTDLLETLLSRRFKGGQLRVILWVIRNTYGWNRTFTPFTWYRVAKELCMNRSAVYRAGQTLLDARVLTRRGAQLGLCADFGANTPTQDNAGTQQSSSPTSNAGVAGTQQERCQEASLFRRVKDSSKDRLKTYKDRREEPISLHRSTTRTPTHLSENTRSPRKYDRLSEN